MNWPDQAAWAEFTSTLDEAAEKFSANFDQGGTTGTVEALMAVVALLQATEAPPSRWIPFLRLALALSDLKDGKKVHPAFKPEGKAGRGPKGVAGNDHVQRAALAALLERVFERKDFESFEAAAKWVARKGRRLPSLINAGSAEPWETIKDWREEIRASPKQGHPGRAVYERYLATLRANPRMDREDMARHVIGAAATFKTA